MGVVSEEMGRKTILKMIEKSESFTTAKTILKMIEKSESFTTAKTIELEPTKVTLFYNYCESNYGEMTGVEIPLSSDEYSDLRHEISKVKTAKDFEMLFILIAFNKLKELLYDC
jgi:N-methylhydantoinase B/oxoprolinase/acetone carboxylase alpha subunit